MSSNLNSHRMIGNLGADPEIKTFENGNKVANIRVATTDRWKDKTSGERKERTEWHNVTIYGGLVDVVEKYCKKGSKVYVEGQPRTRKWQDKDGNDRYTTEVVVQGNNSHFELLDGNRSSENASSGDHDDNGSGTSGQDAPNVGASGGPDGFDPDDLPF